MSLSNIMITSILLHTILYDRRGYITIMTEMLLIREI